MREKWYPWKIRYSHLTAPENFHFSMKKFTSYDILYKPQGCPTYRQRLHQNYTHSLWFFIQYFTNNDFHLFNKEIKEKFSHWWNCFYLYNWQMQTFSHKKQYYSENRLSDLGHMTPHTAHSLPSQAHSSRLHRTNGGRDTPTSRTGDWEAWGGPEKASNPDTSGGDLHGTKGWDAFFRLREKRR